MRNAIRSGLVKRLLLTATLSLTSWSAMALTVGVLHWKTNPGQPPVAEIGLSDKNPIDPGSIRVSIATPAAYSVAGLSYFAGLADALITAQATASGAAGAMGAPGHPVLRLERLPPNTPPFDLLIVVSDRAALTLTEFRIDRPDLTHDVPPSRVGTRAAILAKQAKPQPTLPPGVKASQEVEGPAHAALLAWSQAWSQRDVTAYLAAYTPDYAGNPAQASHQVWADQRRERIEARTHISVELKKIELVRQGNTVIANFVQRYTSDGPSDRLHKRVVLVHKDGRWLIQNELVVK
ncbi:MAG: hypothetical protein PHQ58_09230 [Rhodoferax sp.]|uniref:YybH family protein n=1 Tax=Rhodoferax sp. TaxID=50421 RepID=UPI0026208469|nr:hypothetical protein [Rhodoferax sp.]MDD2880608.1 hypothetical protein [Rhodoferax sp.]